MNGRSDGASAHETLHSRFERIAETNPARTAVVAGSDTLTYGELNERANRLAWRLRALGVGRHSLVGLCVDRSAEMIVGILAILKAGGAYVPLDPGYPHARLKFILDDSAVSVVVAHAHLIPGLPDGTFTPVAIDDTAAFSALPPTNLEDGPASAEDVAYVIYTSGSTGVPKGVLTTHGNVTNLVRDQNYLTITPEDRLSAVASLSFDASTLEIWGALLNGATCHVYRFSGTSLSELFQRVHSDGISVLALTSPVFRVLEPSHFELAKSVRAMFFGGDSVRTDVVVRARELFDGELIHVYGPTETTSFSVVLKEGTLAVDAPLYPIGYPIEGVTVRVVGPNGEPAAAGDEGELHIGGRGVARGYLNRPELTDERFLGGATGASASRFYRTGDLVRVGRDGELHFLGRLDRQLKIRGHRIEPAEIEAALTQHAGVSDAVVVGRPDGAGDKRLHAYVVRDQTMDNAVEDHELVADLRQYVGTVLPAPQRPATFTIIESIPFTSNLKLDEASLPPPSEPTRAVRHVPTSPSRDFEVLLVDLWGAKLDVGNVEIDDNFFDLGGDSMLAFQIAAAAREAIGVRFGARAIFKYPTIRSLADAIANGEVGEAVHDAPTAEER